MSVNYHERPGVYSDYTASRVLASRDGGKTVGIVGVSAAESGLYTLYTRTEAESLFGKDSSLGRMLRAAYENGAGKILAYSLKGTGAADYAVGVAAVLAEKEAAFCALDSTEETVQTALRDAVEASSRQKGECVGLVGLSKPDKSALLARAKALDSERMVLLGPDVCLSGETEAAGGCLAAAALCGVLASQTDPALPLAGTELAGFSSVTDRYEEEEIDALVRGGVTVLEAAGGKVTVLRGITTRDTTSSGRDTTWRELSTLLVVDDVIPGIRRALAARFARAKNTASTRASVRALVVMELESRLRREIIDGYSDLTVKPSDTDAAVCQVSFGFAVTRGLNRIELTAHISV